MERRIATVVVALPISALMLEKRPQALRAWDLLAHIDLVSEVEAEFLVSIPIEQ
jgi:hypothetical protein